MSTTMFRMVMNAKLLIDVMALNLSSDSSHIRVMASESTSCHSAPARYLAASRIFASVYRRCMVSLRLTHGLAIQVTLHLFSPTPVTENDQPSYFPLMYDRSGEIDRSDLSIMIDFPTFINWNPYCDVKTDVFGRPTCFLTVLMGGKVWLYLITFQISAKNN